MNATNTYECPIYSTTNWHMITYLFKGTTSASGNRYAVFLDSDSLAFKSKLDKLSRVSPYLAQVIASYIDMNGIVFVKRFLA